MELVARHQQAIKWIVYGILFLNWGYYMFDDWRAANTALADDAGLLETMSAYATSLDNLGWFAILALLEIETWWMEDDTSRGAWWSLQIIRILAYVLVLHTMYAYVGIALDFEESTMLETRDVCALAGQDLSFLRNLLYTPIEAGNCASLTTGEPLYRIHGEPAISDASGLALELRHSWIDVLELSCWFALSLAITFVIFVQDRGIFRSRMISIANRFQIVIYLILAALAIYWAYYTFYVYTWDIFVWAAGFAIIDANLSEWRDELAEEKGAHTRA